MKKKEIIDIGLVVFAAIYNLAVLAIALLWLFTNKFSTTKASLTNLEMFDVNENVTYGLFLSGALGGAFYCLRALYQRLGQTFTPVEGKPKKTSNMNMVVWIFWYLYRPIQGGVLALVLLILTKGSLMSIDTANEFTLKSYYALIGLGFLSGFGAHEVIHKIQELIQVLFAKSKFKPSNSKEKVKENKGE
jgi:hypothetical protein